jgi:hypothetical protein
MHNIFVTIRFRSPDSSGILPAGPLAQQEDTAESQKALENIVVNLN